MDFTTYQHGTSTWTLDGQGGLRKEERRRDSDDEQLLRFQSLLNDQRMSWTEHHRLLRLLGSGGQGVVYLSERRGADNFTLPVALKIFSPDRFADAQSYDEAMSRIAKVAAHVAQIQQDNLLDVHNFVDRNRVRIMVMEWIDGYDLTCLLSLEMLEKVRKKVSQRRWDNLNNVTVTSGPVHARLQPGVAVSVLRECLGALAALHREDVVHGDMKPSNIMLKKTGTAKIIDIGSAFERSDPPLRRTCTPSYAAPEVLEGGEATPRSDLASLGYVLIEMLIGRPLFNNIASLKELLEAKRQLVQRLREVLPEQIARNELMMHLIRGLVAPDPTLRYPSADAANLDQGAAGVQRQLVKGDLASEYVNDIRQWLLELE